MRLLLASILVSCTPSPPTGVPCNSDAECPSSQVCHTISRTCEASCDGCAVDAAVDQPIDAPADCWAAWLDHTVILQPPTKLDQLAGPNGAGTANPSITADDLSLYFERNEDIFRATRSTPDGTFSAGSLVSELQTTARDSRISTTLNDRLAIFASARQGTIGLLDLWQATRQGNQPFGNPSSVLFIQINTTSNEFDPEITPEGLDLYWAPSINGPQQIRHASRSSVGGLFGNPDVIALTAPNKVAFFDPAISPDQRVIAFAADDGTLGATGDLFYATRASTADGFGAAIEITDLNTTSHEGDSELSFDGCTLYFSSNRDGTSAIYASAVKR